MDAGSLGGLLSGVAALVTVATGTPMAYRRMRRQVKEEVRKELGEELEECRDHNADLQFMVGTLIDLLPGGYLAEKFGVTSLHEVNPEFSEFVIGLRQRAKKREQDE